MSRGRLFMIAALAMLLAAPALAQTYYDKHETPYPIGVRVGYTSWESMRQMHFGADMKLGELMENISFTPGFEVGVGDDVTVLALNGDVTWSFSEMVNAPWGLYGGGSLSLIRADLAGPNNETGDADTKLGLSALGGLTRRLDNGHDAMFEVRVGLLDSPGWKLTLGYSLF